MFLISLGHFIAILWYELALFQINYLGETKTWIQQLDIVEKEWHVRYIYSFFCSGSLITNVGLTPNSLTEIFLSQIGLFATCGIFAYVISCIQLILFDLGKKREMFDKQL